MADYLVDTNVLLRSCDPGSPAHGVATAAVAALLESGDQVYVTPQNIIEFWVVATRPVDVNGPGWDPGKAWSEVERLLDQFELLGGSPAIFSHWLQSVSSLSILGKRGHDARLVAVMRAFGVSGGKPSSFNSCQV